MGQGVAAELLQSQERVGLLAVDSGASPQRPAPLPYSCPACATCSGIKTPSQVAPSFTRLKGLNASVNEATGTFSVQLSTDLDRAGQVFFAVYRYSAVGFV